MSNKYNKQNHTTVKVDASISTLSSAIPITSKIANEASEAIKASDKKVEESKKRKALDTVTSDLIKRFSTWLQVYFTTLNMTFQEKQSVEPSQFFLLFKFFNECDIIPTGGKKGINAFGANLDVYKGKKGIVTNVVNFYNKNKSYKYNVIANGYIQQSSRMGFQYYKSDTVTCESYNERALAIKEYDARELAKKESEKNMVKKEEMKK